jgi:hypothetical protein
MLSLPSMPANSTVLLAAVDALSAAQLAVDKRNLPLIERSRSLYGTALTQMLQAIQDPVTAVKDETLLSTYLLTLFEVCVWKAHICIVCSLVFRSSSGSRRVMASSTMCKAFYICSSSVGLHLSRAG